MRRRLVAFLLIASTVAGCGGYRTVDLPLESMPGAEDFPIRVKSSARVVLASGEKVSGEVVAVGDEEFVIGAPGNYGWRETAVTYSDLMRLEVQCRSTPGLVSLLSGGVLLFSALVIHSLASVDWSPS